MSGIAARWRGLSLWVRDGLLALALTVVGQVELVLVADEVVGPLPLQHAAFALITGSLVARRARPLSAAVAGAVGLTFQTLLGDAPVVSGFAAILVLTYSVAQYADRRRDALLGLLAVLAAIESYAFVVDEVNVGDEVANLAIPIIIWIFARLARERLDRAVAAEREAAGAREAVAGERRRIAREMHDVVGHGVTLMLLHTDAVQARLAARDPETAAHLDVVLTSGRTALEDLHRLLRVLRETPGEDATEDPGTLAAVAPLVERAGGQASLVVEGPVRPLPAAVETTGYRIVQESLTNALKHAPGARVQVLLRYTDSALEVCVADDGAARPGGEPRSGGHGLLGVRERVALFDGRVSAGPRDDGPGWRVRAELPVPAPEPAAV